MIRNNHNRVPANSFRSQRKQALRLLLNGDTEGALSLLSNKKKTRFKVRYVEMNEQGNIIHEGKIYTVDEYKVYAKENGIHFIHGQKTQNEDK